MLDLARWLFRRYPNKLDSCYPVLLEAWEIWARFRSDSKIGTNRYFLPQLIFVITLNTALKWLLAYLNGTARFEVIRLKRQQSPFNGTVGQCREQIGPQYRPNCSTTLWAYVSNLLCELCLSVLSWNPKAVQLLDVPPSPSPLTLPRSHIKRLTSFFAMLCLFSLKLHSWTPIFEKEN